MGKKALNRDRRIKKATKDFAKWKADVAKGKGRPRGVPLPPSRPIEEKGYDRLDAKEEAEDLIDEGLDEYDE